MEINARIIFKHGIIKRIVNSHGLTMKQLSTMCGWEYQNLIGFVNFKRLPQKESKTALFEELKKLDNTIKFDDIFPKEYDIAKEVFCPREISNDIPLDKIVEFDEKKLLTYDENQDMKLDAHKFNKRIYEVLSKREAYIIKLRYGIDGGKQHTLREIAKKTNLSADRIRQILMRICRKLYRDREFYKLASGYV